MDGMKIIRPLTITDTMLTASNVAETDYSEFAMGTTYAAGDYCIVATGLETLTLDVAPAPAAWAEGATITGASSGKSAKIVQKVSSTVYQIRERSGSFTLGEILSDGTNTADQGAAYPTVTAATDKVHKIYQSLSAGNQGNYPPLDVLKTVPKWLDIGATNRWKCFDNSVGTLTENASSITYTITPGVIFDSIAFLALTGQTVRIKLTDPTDGVVYDETVNLLDMIPTGTIPDMDWYAYFFSDIRQTSEVARPGISLYLNTVVEITITYTGGTAKVGGIILGTQMTLGNTLYSPQVGIRDYSIKGTDDYGNPQIVERAYANRGTFDILIPTASIAYIRNVLASYRATLLLWIGADDYEATIIYGFFKEFNIVISYPDYAECSIEIEGIS